MSEVIYRVRHVFKATGFIILSSGRRYYSHSILSTHRNALIFIRKIFF
jgi:hypothetical protein